MWKDRESKYVLKSNAGLATVQIGRQRKIEVRYAFTGEYGLEKIIFIILGFNTIHFVMREI